MSKRAAIVFLAAMFLLAAAAPAWSAQRTVLAEMFGHKFCGYCPPASDALTQLRGEWGTDQMFFLYYRIHPADPYYIPEASSRAAKYGVGGTPHTVFDGFEEYVGGPPNVYDIYAPIVEAHHNIPSPVRIHTAGVIGETDGWVTAQFVAEDTLDYGTLRAQFVIYEDIDEDAPATVRDMLPGADVVMSAPGDSVEITKNFTVDAGWGENLNLAVILETKTGDPYVLNAQLIPDMYDVVIRESDRYAAEMPLLQEVRFYTSVKHTGMVADTVLLDISVDFPGAQWDWFYEYCIMGSGECWWDPHPIHMEPGQVESVYVRIWDLVGTHRDIGYVTFSATSEGDPTKSASETYAVFGDMHSVLLVDDDGGDSLETYMETALVDTGYPPVVWDASTEGRPSLAHLSSYRTVVWTTGDSDATQIDAGDEANLGGYLDQGGTLLLASRDYLSSRAGPTTFTTDYLHIDSWQSNTPGYIMTGVPGDAISDGMTLGLLGGPFPADDSDTVYPLAPADSIFYCPYGPKGLKVAADGYQAVLLAFPFENVKVVNTPPSNQKSLVRRVMEWFVPYTGVDDGPAAVETKLALGQNFPNPFNPTTTIRFSVPSGAPNVRLTIHNVNGRVVKTLVDSPLAAGPHAVTWDGTNGRGRSVASGVYFCRIEAGGDVRRMKMALLK